MVKPGTNLSYLLALLATIVWSGNFIVARGLNEVYTPITISFFRWGIASIGILPIAYHYLRKDFDLLKRQWKLMLILSFLGVTLFNTLIYTAAHFTSALNLSLLAITAPFYVVILNRIVFKEKLNIRQVVGFFIVAAGLLALLSKGDLQVLMEMKFNKGDLLMAVAATVFATYSILVQKKNPEIGSLSFVSATFIIGEILLAPLFVAEQLLSAPDIEFTKRSFFQLLYIGIGPSIISFYLWNKAIVSIGSTRAATIYNTLPIFSAFFASLILDEPILALQIISALVTITGIILVIWSSNKRSQPTVAKQQTSA